MLIRLIADLPSLERETEKYLPEEDPDDLLSAQFEVGLAFSHFESSVDFHVSGFGQEHWPLSLQTDFVIFLEHLTSLYQWLHEDAKDEFVLDFYEQGVEREIHFARVKDLIRISCESHTDWTPYPTVESVFLSEFIKEIDMFISMLFLCLKLTSPLLYKNSSIIEWRKQLHPIAHLP